MTEEEYFRKNNPDFCYGEKPLSPYWDLFQEGVEFGERQSEKKIEKLEEENRRLNKLYTLAKDVVKQFLNDCVITNDVLDKIEPLIKEMKIEH
jgi:hypothetical protein